ncbi:YdeI/OmpD-associated family protein [Paucibacter sp. APW11]|uniref:YdeI/OmpD-associated family protein n=1 Tax=Roseateles aquae TaxID=3077235 RepID=A0ABU3PIY5_9BURK|nr:YdeI/OmpD-associated family protein [Paucibacter sp. APW11]MDT9002429.1 YdeI/OmpD-associated family protein [Paucibacter sp. APW11]
MPHTDARVDAYLEAAADFAQPLLRDWRARVHRRCPGAEETIKWGFPHFVYQGKILSSMAAFKAHCSIGFWHGEAVSGSSERREGMGELGKLRSAADLPPAAELDAMLDRARALIEAGVKPARQQRTAAKRPPPPLPADLAQALAANEQAAAFFQSLPPSHQREYTEWLDEAKREETRAKRLAQTLEWLSEGKSRNWKYKNC